MHPASLQERRRSPRRAPPPRVRINVLRPEGLIPVEGVNISEGGLCFRCEEMLEMRSLVRCQLAPEGGGSASGQGPVECAGRVVWVIQRLDLRSAPPFMFDVGIEFVNPPPLLRQWLAGRGGASSPPKPRAIREKMLDPLALRGRQFIPRLVCEASTPARWHLIVSVDGAPCFSGRYASEREALAAWAQFQRRQPK